MRTPPSTLRPPSKRTLGLLRLLWAALLVLAIVGQAGGIRRHFVQRDTIDPIFASIGLSTESDDENEGFLVNPATQDTLDRGVPEHGWLYRIDGKDIDEEMTQDEVAKLLAGPDGSSVKIAVADEDGENYGFTLERSAANRAEALENSSQLLWTGLLFVVSLLAIPYVGAAALLLLRRREDPVSLLLSFAFLALAAWGAGPALFWDSVGMEWVWEAITSVWLSLLILVFLAFPDGRFSPGWGRWMLIVLPILNGILALPDIPDELGYSVLSVVVVILLIAIAALVRRYRRTPPGIERQQIKWAAFGLVGGPALLAAAGIPLALASGPFSESAAAQVLALAALVLLYLGFLVLPVGVLISVLRYRLNDADAAIGRSAAYAAVTLIIGIVWAVSSSWVNKLVSDFAGNSGNGAVATGISTVIAAAVFVPARQRVNGWAEQRFQQALVRLRSLPKRLAQWQHGDNPEEVAAAALAAIVDGVHADRAAVIVERDGGRQVLATFNFDPATLAERLRDETPGEEADADFPIRSSLADGSGTLGEMWIGPRSDGARYRSDEWAAIASVTGPLTEALRATSRRAQRNAAFASWLKAVEDRLARIETPR